MPSAISVSFPTVLSSQCPVPRPKCQGQSPEAGGQHGPYAPCCWDEALAYGPRSLILPGRAPAREVSIHPSYRQGLSTAVPGGKKVGGMGGGILT